VYINNVYKYSSSNAGWHYPVIDVSGYSGICEVKIMIASGDAYENNVYIDNIRLDGLLEPEPEPDVPVYYLNDEVYFSQYSYSYNQTPRLYFDMTDYVDTIGLRDNLDPFLQDPDNYLSWLEEFIGYWVTYYEVRFYEADYYDGRFYDVTSYPFHSYDISEIDYDSVGTEYYYDVFDPLRGRWIRGELVRHVEYYYSPFPTVITGYYVGSVDTVIDKDYAYCYDQGETEYQPPEEEPEIQQPEQPNPTQPNSTIEYPVVPAYNSTYTPPQSQEGNETTVGTSFLDGYYQTVDSIFNPINVTMSAVVSFVTSPLDIISSSVFQVNGYAAGTFDTALFYISPFGLFFTVIFNAIPDDAEIVIMFALICNLILIVLRWK
jgi:GNAT superfamily N-acetyltransferase